MYFKMAIKIWHVQVGPSYGRLMMHGFLRSRGLSAVERRVGTALRAANEPYNRESAGM